VTLPEDVLARLRLVDPDVGRAIVSIAERKTPPHPRRQPPAETASHGGRAAIVVDPARALSRLDGVQLVPVGDGRVLISLGASRSIAQFELGIRDALETGKVDRAERPTLEAVAGILRRARLSRSMALEERTIIVLKARRRRRR
jgi:hypothetical protein